MPKIAPPPGVSDIFPDEATAWLQLESAARKVFGLYGFGELRTPIFEFTEVFQRGLGGETEVVQKTLDYIADELAAGRDIELRNFGVFEIRVRKGRKGRNPKVPQITVPIPERKVVKFRAGKELKDRVASLKID